MKHHTIILGNNNQDGLPKYADVHLGYVCPECQSQIWIRASEAKICRAIECLGCGRHLKIVSLDNISVTYSMQAKVANVVKKKLPKCVKEAVALMTALQYSKAEALQHIKSVPNYKLIDDAQLLVRRTLETIKPSE
jgi:hypothetical protein